MNKYIKSLAEKCASCVTKPCQVGCPLNNDITTFISYIKQNKVEDAFNSLQNTTVLPALCGRVCPHFNQCQKTCVKAVAYEAVSIGKLEAFVGDESLKNGWILNAPKKTKYKVAVIGGGPAGLTCAAFLRKNGIGVTIYEKYDYLGGLLVHGIPDFRLPKDIVKNTVDKILAMGIDVIYNMELGKNLNLEELEKEYDAIFIGIGANCSNSIDIPGDNLEGVYGGNEILENKSLDYKDKIVAVIGGGDVAMDVSRTAIRNGAKKAIVLYRRSAEEMPANEVEYKEALEDGVEFLFLSSIIKISGTKKVEKITIVKNELVKKENDLRLSPEPIPNSDYEMICDYVISAIGAHPDKVVESINVDKNKDYISTDIDGHTSNPKVYAGGDIIKAKSTVAWAARSGRNAAYTIIKDLMK